MAEHKELQENKEEEFEDKPQEEKKKRKLAKI